MNNKYLGYTLVNLEKLDRAIHGTMSRGGQLIGGVGENASDEAIIAEYDRLGGCIKKDKNQVQMGSFYDFKKRAPRAKPDVVLVFRDLQGEVVLLKEDEEIPLEVKAAQVAEEKKIAKVEKKGKKAKSIEDEE